MMTSESKKFMNKEIGIIIDLGKPKLKASRKLKIWFLNKLLRPFIQIKWKN